MEVDYEQELLDLIDSKGDTEEIIDQLRYSYKLYNDEGSQHRWETWYWGLAKVKDRYFGFTYSEGNTEYQDGSNDGEYYELFFEGIVPIGKVEVVFKDRENKRFVAFESKDTTTAMKLLEME